MDVIECLYKYYYENSSCRHRLCRLVNRHTFGAAQWGCGSGCHSRKVNLINQKKSPILDEYIEKYLAEKNLNLRATLDGREAYKDAEFVVIAAPTNYDPQKNFFDTHHIEDVIDLVLEVNPEAIIVIKSTIPVGYTRSLYVKYAKKLAIKDKDSNCKLHLLFSPEFCVSHKHFMTISILHALLLAIPR